MWTQILLLVVIPLVLLADLFRARHPDRGSWLLAASLTGAYLFLATLVGRWDYISSHLVWFWFLLFAGALYLPSRRRDRGGPSSLRKKAGVVRTATSAIVLVALLVGSWLAWSGRSAPEDIPSFVFPLHDGPYFIAGGGASRLINRDHANPARAYGLEIVKLNAWGARAAGFAPRGLEQYEIFGDVVYSPCAGTILHVEDEHPDRTPPERDAGGADGNRIILECNRGRVVLAHLRQGSAVVSAGERVSVGDPLAQVGNSGDSPQPHLHVRVQRPGDSAGSPLSMGEGIPVQWEGRFLVRGQVVRSRPVLDLD